MPESDLERTFDTLWKQLAPGYPAPEKEYRFHPRRKWRFDRAWPSAYKSPWDNAAVMMVRMGVAVELEGGVWTSGRHVRGSGFEADCEKYNEAAALGWKVFRFTASMLRDDPARLIEMVKRAL